MQYAVSTNLAALALATETPGPVINPGYAHVIKRMPDEA